MEFYFFPAIRRWVHGYRQFSNDKYKKSRQFTGRYKNGGTRNMQNDDTMKLTEKQKNQQ